MVDARRVLQHGVATRSRRRTALKMAAFDGRDAQDAEFRRIFWTKCVETYVTDARTWGALGAYHLDQGAFTCLTAADFDAMAADMTRALAAPPGGAPPTVASTGRGLYLVHDQWSLLPRRARPAVARAQDE